MTDDRCPFGTCPSCDNTIAVGDFVFGYMIQLLRPWNFFRERAYEPKQYGPDWYEGETPSAFGGQRPMTVRMRITTPKDMMANGVGERVRDEVHGDTRTVEWRTDHPVMAFNVVAGRYEVKTGPGTALYYHAAHSYNVDEMIDAMKALTAKDIQRSAKTYLNKNQRSVVIVRPRAKGAK